ncbi:hypothetical protein A2U01_0068816 [Trifolium medium]|uniref:Uncharacterized protein n=1 Tax=Trifolium medium TaxID=97028 RepID=A0A392SHA6_9FABA|nr:hypothetical protein [Trifolium medium]
MELARKGESDDGSCNLNGGRARVHARLKATARGELGRGNWRHVRARGKFVGGAVSGTGRMGQGDSDGVVGC